MYFIDFKQHVCVSMSSTVILVNSSESDTGDVCLPSSISADASLERNDNNQRL